MSDSFNQYKVDYQRETFHSGQISDSKYQSCFAASESKHVHIY